MKQASRRVILVRPEYTRPAYQRKDHTDTTPRSSEAGKTGTPTPLYRGGMGGPRNTPADACQEENENSAEKLLEMFRTLPQQQRKLFLDQAAAAQLLDSANTEAARDVQMWSAAVYDALCAAVGGPGAINLGPLSVKKVLGAATAFAPVASFMAVGGMDKLPVVDRQAVYVLLADLLVKHAKGIARHTGTPLALKLVANCTNNIAGVFDNAFPGYLQAGLAPLVARQMHRNQHKAIAA